MSNESRPPDDDSDDLLDDLYAAAVFRRSLEVQKRLLESKLRVTKAKIKDVDAELLHGLPETGITLRCGSVLQPYTLPRVKIKPKDLLRLCDILQKSEWKGILVKETINPSQVSAWFRKWGRNKENIPAGVLDCIDVIEEPILKINLEDG